MSAAGDLRTAASGEYYAARADQLTRMVANRVGQTDPAAIEDACHTAWTQLLSRPDITLDFRGLRWLAVVAVHHLWRTARRDHRIPVGFIRAADQLEPLVDADGGDLLERVAARDHHLERAEDFRQLKLAERQALGLQAIGYSYAEIAELSGGRFVADGLVLWIVGW